MCVEPEVNGMTEDERLDMNVNNVRTPWIMMHA